jgi:hypothetical protein
MMIMATEKNSPPQAALCAQSKRDPLRMILLDFRIEPSGSHQFVNASLPI